MIIDSHQHVFWLNRDDAGLTADLDEHGIDLAWLLTWEVTPNEIRENRHNWYENLNPLNLNSDGTHAGVTLRDILIAREHFPDRYIVGYCPHPLVCNAADMFLTAHKMHNVRICGEWKFRMLFDDPRCLELYRAAGACEAPVVLHLDVPYLPDEQGKMTYYERWYGGTVLNVERALQACPQTNFIGHAPGFWREISGDADRQPGSRPRLPVKQGGRLYRLFDEYPNLYADISATSGINAFDRDHEHARNFLIQYADRLLFGRDQYGPDHQNLLQSLELPEDVFRKLSFLNANKLVPLEPQRNK